MNLLLLEAAEAAGGRVVLAGRRAEHLVRVLRVVPGQVLRAGVVRGPRGDATVVAIEGERVVVELALERPPSPRPLASLVLALPRPKALGRALEAAAASGIDRVDLVNAWRVDRAYFDSPRLGDAALAEHLWLGCEQGGTTWLPEVAIHRRLMPFLAAPPAWPTDARRLLAHPRAARPLEAVAAPGDARPVVLAIGPDGGFVDRELDSFAALGFEAVSLGDAVLRTEHAVAAALAQLALLARLPAPGA